MIVYGWQVPDNVIEACESAMVDGFTAAEIESVAILYGAPKNGTSMRIADRLIQKHKRAGHIWFDGKVWRHQ